MKRNHKKPYAVAAGLSQNNYVHGDSGHRRRHSNDTHANIGRAADADGG